MPPPAAFNRFRPQPQPKDSEATPTADAITKQVLAFLDQQGYAAWRQPNEGRYDPDRQQWYPHPNARRGVPDIIGFRRADGCFIGVEGTQDERPAPTASAPSRSSSSTS